MMLKEQTKKQKHQMICLKGSLQIDTIKTPQNLFLPPILGRKVCTMVKKSTTITKTDNTATISSKIISSLELNSQQVNNIK